MEGNLQSETSVPDKNLFRIGEVSRLTATKPFVLRFWETEFPMLQPVKSPKGHRLYRREDIETVFVIKRLLYDEGFTIAGARRHLSDQNRRTEWCRRHKPKWRCPCCGIRAANRVFIAARHTEPRDAARLARLAPLFVDGSGI